MILTRERITLQPLEESLTNTPLELAGVRAGHGVYVAQGGSTWAPAATETPQLAQSVDTEGGLAIATTVGLRDSPVIRFAAIEPEDPAGVNYVTNPQCVNANGYAPAVATGVFEAVAIRDLVGFDYAIFQQSPGTNSGEGVYSGIMPVPSVGGIWTGGVWLKGALGGEAVTVTLFYTGGLTAASQQLILTGDWQWYTVSGAFTGNQAWLSVVASAPAPQAFYATGWAIVNAPSLSEYFDGTYPGCAWTGVPHASSSTRPDPGGPRLNAIMADLERVVTQISRYRSGTIRRITPTFSGDPLRITYDLVHALLSWDETEYMAAGIAQGTITFTAQPYGRGPELTTTLDKFLLWKSDDYIIDNTTVADLGQFTASGGKMNANGIELIGEARIINNASPYPLHSGEVSAQFTPGATVTGWKGGVISERTDPDTYLEGYVADDGVHSTLYLDRVLEGVRTTVLSTTLGTRVVSGTNYVVRLRTQRQNNNDLVYVEYFANSVDPVAPTVAPTATLGPYTIVDVQYGALIPAAGGISIIPIATGAAFSALRISPYLARERTLPALRFGLCGIPGSASALGRMIIQDDAGQSQKWCRWGQQTVEMSSLSALTDPYLEAEQLTPLNGASIGAVAGSSSGNAVTSASLTSTPTAMLQTAHASPYGEQAHVGYFTVYARVKALTSTGITIALQWTIGDLLRWTTNPSIAPSLYSQWILVELGPINLPAVIAGLQQWRGQLLASGTPGDTLVVDSLLLVPLDDGGAEIQGIGSGDYALFSGAQLEVRSDRANRMDAAKTLWTPPSAYTGTYMRIPNPRYYDGVDSVVVKCSRGIPAASDVYDTISADAGIDALEVQVNLIPRYAQIPDA